LLENLDFTFDLLKIQ